MMETRALFCELTVTLLRRRLDIFEPLLTLREMSIIEELLLLSREFDPCSALAGAGGDCAATARFCDCIHNGMDNAAIKTEEERTATDETAICGYVVCLNVES